MRDALTKLEFYVPVKTVSEANSRDHWAKRNRRKLAQQTAVWACWLEAAKGQRVKLPCSVRLLRIAPKVLDDDNLKSAFKGIRDEIARRLGVDDGSSQVRFEYDQVAIGEHSYNVKVEVRSL